MAQLTSQPSTGSLTSSASDTSAYRRTTPRQTALSNDNTARSATPFSRRAKAMKPDGRRSRPLPFGPIAPPPASRLDTPPSSWCMVWNLYFPLILSRLTFLVPNLTGPLSTADLLAIRARQLRKRPADLATIHDRIFASQHCSVHPLKKQYANTIRDFDFTSGTLILVHNTSLTLYTS